MRIIAGEWRGRRLVAPPGASTRPTADRMRQALFDRLLHAPWAGRAALDGARVLDGFAGTGAFGLEALSRGAASAVFLERDPAALAAIRTNIAACRAAERCTVSAADALRPPPGPACTLAFLDPPYGKDLITPALAALDAAGYLVPGTLILAESARADDLPAHPLLADFTHGAARIIVWRHPG